MNGANWGHVLHAGSTAESLRLFASDRSPVFLLRYGYMALILPFKSLILVLQIKKQRRARKGEHGVFHVISVVTIAWPADSYSHSDGRLTVSSGLSHRPTTPAISLIFTRLLS